jgi:putative peptidoglycan lipid II flippase
MSFARNIATVGVGTLVSRLMAYARDAGIAAWLGTSVWSEAFFLVLQIVNFFRRLLSEGALNSAFVPLWLKLKAAEDGSAQADRFTRRTLATMALVTGIVALAAIVFAPWIVHALAPGFDAGRTALATVLLRIVALYVLLAGIVAVVAAALNAEGRVGAIVLSTVAFNFVMLLALGIAAAAHVNEAEVAVWLCVSVLAAGVLQILIAGTAWLASGTRFRRPRIRVPDQTRVAFARMLPGLIATGIPQLKLIAGTAIASASPAAVAWLYYANRLYELPLGVASVAIAAVIVPKISASLRSGAPSALAASQSRAYEIALGLALPAATGFGVLAGPIAAGLFEHGAFTERDTLAVSAALSAICIGLPGHVLEKVFGAISFAHEDTRTPMLTALCGLAAAIVGSLLLFPRAGQVGVAAAIGLSGWVGAAALGVVLRRRHWLALDADARRRLPRIVLASAVMGICIEGCLIFLTPGLALSAEERAIVLVTLVAVGVCTYVFTLQLLAVVSFKTLVAALRERV